jgi:hypothetical protein
MWELQIRQQFPGLLLHLNELTKPGIYLELLSSVFNLHNIDCKLLQKRLSLFGSLNIHVDVISVFNLV